MSRYVVVKFDDHHGCMEFKQMLGELVRCSECVYSYEVDTDFGALRFCKKYQYHFNADDFCSYGKVSEKPTGSERSSE